MGVGGPKVVWRLPVELVDVQHTLPLLLSLLKETDEPRRLLAYEASLDLIETRGAELATVVPQAVPHLRAALNTRNPATTVTVLKVRCPFVVFAGGHSTKLHNPSPTPRPLCAQVLSQLSTCDGAVGAALVPHYGQLLPHLAIHLLRGDPSTPKGSPKAVDFPEAAPLDFDDNLWLVVLATLESLELSGGADARAAIRRYVPAYKPVCGTGTSSAPGPKR